MAPPAWNAGFSRHSGPQGRGRFVANQSGRTRSRAIPANDVVPPPACGGLCRLKPAQFSRWGLQAVPATLGLSIPARPFMPRRVCRFSPAHPAVTLMACFG